MYVYLEKTSETEKGNTRCLKYVLPHPESVDLNDLSYENKVLSAVLTLLRLFKD